MSPRTQFHQLFKVDVSGGPSNWKNRIRIIPVELIPTLRKHKCYPTPRRKLQTPRQTVSQWRSRLEETRNKENPVNNVKDILEKIKMEKKNSEEDLTIPRFTTDIVKSEVAPRQQKTCRWEKVIIKSQTN